jgi:hypothetical protein
MIGIVAVACFAPRTAGVLQVTIASTGRAGQFGGEGRIPRVVAAGPAELELRILPLDPAALLQPLLQAVDRPQRRRGEHSDPHLFCGIGSERRARHYRAADHRDELAAPHSMISSALASSD